MKKKNIFACREIRDLKQLVLDKDGAVTGCQDQLGSLLQQEYHGVKVKYQVVPRECASKSIIILPVSRVLCLTAELLQLRVSCSRCVSPRSPPSSHSTSSWTASGGCYLLLDISITYRRRNMTALQDRLTRAKDMALKILQDTVYQMVERIPECSNTAVKGAELEGNIGFQ